MFIGPRNRLVSEIEPKMPSTNAPNPAAIMISSMRRAAARVRSLLRTIAS
jgi:hypothetical protein